MFKKPYINAMELTYMHIHKPALLGLFGAIIGLGGHTQKKEDEIFQKKFLEYPEYYEKLKDLMVSIKPHEGYFRIFTNQYTNTVGYANKDKEKKPTTLIVKQQLLHKPAWDIYILLNDKVDKAILEKLEKSLLNKDTMFDVYLGKREYAAKIENIEIIELEKPEEVSYISSLFPKKTLGIEYAEGMSHSMPIEFSEIVPVGIAKNSNRYIEEELFFTNLPIEEYSDDNIYRHYDNILYFL